MSLTFSSKDLQSDDEIQLSMRQENSEIIMGEIQILLETPDLGDWMGLHEQFITHRLKLHRNITFDRDYLFKFVFKYIIHMLE